MVLVQPLKINDDDGGDDDDDVDDTGIILSFAYRFSTSKEPIPTDCTIMGDGHHDSLTLEQYIL